MKLNYSTRLFSILTVLLLIYSGFAFSATISSDLQQRMTAAKSGQPLPVMINMRDRVDLTRFKDGRAGAGDLIQALQDVATRSQAPVVEFLRQSGYQPEIQGFWINNSLALKASPDLIRQLSGLSGIGSIEFDTPVRMFESTPGQKDMAPPVAEWGLNMVGVPDVWAEFGLDGTGIVLGSMDTGMDISHPALAGKWRGGTNSWLDLVNSQPTPYDDHGHGTHTIGTMVGGDGPGPFSHDIGVAYNAKVISAKVLDSNNSFSSASIVIAGAQWMMDPDGDPQTNDFPHAINNSWYFFSSTYTGFYSAAAAWRAEGIIPVFCQGNTGPSSSSTRPPGSYNNVLGIGATTSSDAIASFSSRGPSPSGSSFPADGRKPDLSAPGLGVTSSLPGGHYQAWSGTSMATPHVTGTIALMLQAHPGLSYDDIFDILTNTAHDLGTPGYDYDFGYGRLDSYAALVYLLSVSAADDWHSPATRVKLEASVPNPMNDATSISFVLGAPGRVSLSVYGLDGRLIADLISGRMMQGRNQVRWNGRDLNGRPVPSGVYFYHLQADGFDQSKQLIVVR